MESTIQLIKRKAISLIAQTLSKTGTVLAVRAWEPATVIEADLHLPGVDMQKWTTPQHIKLAVAEGVYRDYTPLGWDAGTATCTLIINASHNGAGARWAQALQPGDIVSYVGIGPTPPKPTANAHVVFLGDESALGHFYAVQQLAQNPLSIRGAIALEDEQHRENFRACCSDFKALEPVSKTGRNHADGLLQWAAAQRFTPDTVFYTAGYIPAVVQVRQRLKSLGISSAQIKAQGFWK
ncbi:Siderophore-interacting protein [Chitinophaga rupis]|uniref:Siderophore-interacting protein n=1 Tax=Chitinophaga rupis TaxID=573321 RepID=A0A1H8HQ56_9BACT|nr:SIP domain-containing protein [Chitinophaga rupis]SEN58147.1 Siderophore-interacting protein [Chitinophaga rupis]